MEIIRAAMDHHCLSDDIPHRKVSGAGCQESPAVFTKQRRQITCMTGMRRIFRIIVPSGVWKAFPCAVFSFVDMQREEAAFALWKSCQICSDQCSAVHRIKFDRSPKSMLSLDAGYGRQWATWYYHKNHLMESLCATLPCQNRKTGTAVFLLCLSVSKSPFGAFRQSFCSLLRALVVRFSRTTPTLAA